MPVEIGSLIVATKARKLPDALDCRFLRSRLKGNHPMPPRPSVMVEGSGVAMAVSLPASASGIVGQMTFNEWRRRRQPIPSNEQAPMPASTIDEGSGVATQPLPSSLPSPGSIPSTCAADSNAKAPSTEAKSNDSAVSPVIPPIT